MYLLILLILSNFVNQCNSLGVGNIYLSQINKWSMQNHFALQAFSEVLLIHTHACREKTGKAFLASALSLLDDTAA